LKRVFGFLSIFGVVVFWGISFVSIKIVLEVMDPILLGFFRYVLAVLFVLTLVIVKRVSLRIEKKDWIIFVMAGLFGIFLYSSLENSALVMISPQSASILTSTVPLSILIANTLVYRERVQLRYFFYVLLSMVGVYFVMSADLKGGSSSSEIFGYVMMIGAVLSWTVYVILTKKVVLKYQTLQVTTLQSIMALLIFLPTLLFRPFPEFASFSINHWGHLVFLGVVCSGVSYYLYIHSVNVLGVTTPNIFLNFIPLVTVITNFIIFQEKIDALQVLGGVIIILTMSMLTYDNYKKAKAIRS